MTPFNVHDARRSLAPHPYDVMMAEKRAKPRHHRCLPRFGSGRYWPIIAALIWPHYFIPCEPAWYLWAITSPFNFWRDHNVNE